MRNSILSGDNGSVLPETSRSKTVACLKKLLIPTWDYLFLPEIHKWLQVPMGWFLPGLLPLPTATPPSSVLLHISGQTAGPEQPGGELPGIQKGKVPAGMGAVGKANTPVFITASCNSMPRNSNQPCQPRPEEQWWEGHGLQRDGYYSCQGE